MTAGTIFAATRLPLKTWFAAVWYVTNQKLGVSALGLQHALGLGSYETAWAMLHKLRRAMVRPGRDRLSGEVEVDESYLGGVAPGKHGRGAEKKAIVAIAVEKRGRGMGRIRLARVPDTSADSLLPAIEDAIEAGSVVCTDGHAGYRPLAGAGYTHDRHSLYATGDPAHVAMPRVHRAARHPPRRRPSAAARLLPRRVHLPLQPPRLQPPRPALLPAARTGRSARARPARGDRRRPRAVTEGAKGSDPDSPLSQRWRHGLARWPACS